MLRAGKHNFQHAFHFSFVMNWNSKQGTTHSAGLGVDVVAAVDARVLGLCVPNTEHFVPIEASCQATRRDFHVPPHHILAGAAGGSAYCAAALYQPNGCARSPRDAGGIAGNQL